MAEITENMVESGIPGLDKILYGGLPCNQMYAIYGISGSGKTTICMQFLLHGLKLGERCLYIGTSETVPEIQRIARSHQWDLTGLDISHLAMLYGEKAGPKQTMLNPAEIELPQLMDNLISRIREYNPQRLVVDSLSEIRLVAREKSWYQRQLMLLKSFLEARACTVFLTDTVGGENTVLKTFAHGCIEMSKTNPLYGPERQRLRVEKLRGHSFISGFHDCEIIKGGVKVFPRLVSAQYGKDFTKEAVSSGIRELDKLLGGGLDRGTCTLIQGASGTGKSVLATQFVAAAAQRNEKSMIFCFDERLATFLERSRGLGMDIDNFISDGLVELRQIDPAEQTAGEFSSVVSESVLQKGFSVIVIDSLNGYAYSLPDERFLVVHLHELASFLNLQGVVTLFNMSQQSGFGLGTIPPPFDVSYVSDTVVNLGYFEYKGAVRKAASVFKKRSGNHERTIRELSMGSNGLHVGPTLQDFEGIATGIPRYIGKTINGGGSSCL